MDNRIHLYVTRKNLFTWIMGLSLICSAALRIYIFGWMDASVNLCSEFLLPLAASVLYFAIIYIDGKECLYKTSVPVWMMAAYGAVAVSHGVQGKLYVWLFWLALAFLALVYTEIISGMRQKCVWLLPIALLAALATLLYNNKQSILSKDWEKILPLLPDLLFIGGGILFPFGFHVHPAGEYHRRWGDRSDGRRIRSLAPMDQVSPYIMVTRNTSSNLFEESFEISNIDRYIRQKRREGLTNFGIMHVFLACYCHSVARYPGVNRFIAGQKVYTHGEDLQFCLTIKKEMSTKSPETIIKVHLSPRDTAYDVYNKVNAEVEKAKNTPLDSGFDNTAHALMLVPGVFLKFVVWLLKTMDYFGLLPKFLLEVSPFHGSIFLTSMGSLGIPPIFHHLYDFGNLPVFGAFGCKRRAVEVEEDGTITAKKYVDVKFTLDERIVDGYYYAAFFKHFRRLVAKPEVLDQPPEEIKADIP